MKLTNKKTCGRKTHKVQVTVYDFETIEQVTGAATFLFEGSTSEIAQLVDKLGANPAQSSRICRQACCQAAAAATGLQDVEEILYE